MPMFMMSCSSFSYSNTRGVTEDGFDRLLTRGELGGDVHQFARTGGGLAP
jgi:hypothetical protein